MFWYHLLDWAFIGFHTALILFNMLGWIWKATRHWNLITLMLTAFSWFVLGIWYGWGYCFCTDWHWQIRRHLGDSDLPQSYMTFLVEIWTGYAPDPVWVDLLTLSGLILALIISITLNFRGTSNNSIY
ncbi:MAG: DUF2784 family protein [Bacteroidota bacterium]